MRVVPTVFLLVSLTLLSGCSSDKSNEQIRLECEKQGKVFKMKDKLNLRTGEKEKVAYCY